MNNVGKILLIVIIAVLVVVLILKLVLKGGPVDPLFKFEESEEHFYNPLMGFAPQASYERLAEENTLVYIEVLWRNFEPEEGVYNYKAIEEASNLAKWREQGKHGVLRFICDTPTNEAHIDIPQWLYDKIDGDGYHYNKYDHMGFSPQYKNEIFIEYHKKAIEKLAEYFNKDTFLSYVQLGSLGHYGEWHLYYTKDENGLPAHEIRELYIKPYVESFKNVRFLTRRPFTHSKNHGFGLYDDMAGHKEDTEEWLGWIQNGGDYNGEKKSLVPMPDAWKTAPIGGEFTSSRDFEWILKFNLPITIELLKKSHTTYLGPKIPEGLESDRSKDCADGALAVLKTMGYRISVSQANISDLSGTEDIRVKLKWQNSGIAPLYWDWPVYLYVLDENDKTLGRTLVNINLSSLLPEKEIVSETKIPYNGNFTNAKKLCIGIIDPMHGNPAVKLTMEAERIGNLSVLRGF